MKLLLAVITTALLWPSGLIAQGADSIAKISADFQAAGQDDDLIDDDEMKSLGGRALALAKAKGGRVGFDATLWTFYVAKYGEDDGATRKKLRRGAMDLVIKRYANSTGSLKKIVAEWRVLRPDDVNEFAGYYRELAKATKKAAVKELAKAGGFGLLSQKADMGFALTDKERKQMLAHWKKLVAEKGDEKNPNDRAGRSYADSLKGKIFEIENLYIGATVPEIAGTDIDGVSFKLSDYRGKVVMLDFWGHW